MRRKLRVAAYAVCVRDGQILLARSPCPDGTHEWVLPGGGAEHGEDPCDTVRREVTEETGYRIEVTGLLGVDSARHTVRGGRLRRLTDHHGVRIVYEGEVVGGALRNEVGGSTDLAAWQDLDAVPGLTRVPLVDVALRLWRERPATGRPAPAQGPLPRQVNGERPHPGHPRSTP
ncbi:NUDIX hydrolase [Streptomyces sp. TG1A-8]|uniref:NUDIX hydrolase n=1 Tax=Streptomyces sp. TG1A-8 TaxID=3051385 RepID=UPI00265C5905|nr:NUDIX hydrolase [Streptomyces sp. TG1A-8]MDO0927696.1 NUDIX hydrolase [Streptomyces sp. TG1A-8]